MMKNIFLYGGIFTGIVIAAWFVYQGMIPAPADSHIHRVAIVNPGGPAFSNFFQGFQDRLKDIHHEGGQSFVIAYKDAKGSSESLKTLVTEAVSERPEFVVTITSPATSQALKEANGIIPVLTALGDPVEHGYIKSLKDPGVLATGIAQQNIELTPKRLEILKEVAPRAKRVAIVYDTTCGPTAKARPITNALAPKLGLEVTEFPLTSPTRDEVSVLLGRISGKDFDALLFYPHGTLFSKADLFLKRAMEEKLITIMPDTESLALGAPVSYGPSYYNMGELLARIAEKIVTDKIDPREIPFEQPQEVELVIHLGNARALGLTIPDAMLGVANRVIE